MRLSTRGFSSGLASPLASPTATAARKNAVPVSRSSASAHDVTHDSSSAALRLSQSGASVGGVGSRSGSRGSQGASQAASQAASRVGSRVGSSSRLTIGSAGGFGPEAISASATGDSSARVGARESARDAVPMSNAAVRRAAKVALGGFVSVDFF